MMSGMSLARYISTVVLSFFLFSVMMVFISGIIVLRTVVNPWYIVSRLNQSGFSESALADIQETYISYGHASGVSPELMVSLITAEHIEDAAEAGIMESFGEGAGFTYENFTNEVFQALRDYAISQDIEITSDVEESLLGLARLCADTLQNYVDSPIFSALAMTRQFTQGLFMVIAASFAIALAIAVAIKSINHRVTRWIDGYIYAAGAAIIACIAIPTAVQATGITRNLQIYPMSYNRFITSWIEGILSGYLIALIPLFLLLGLCVAVRILRWKKRKNYSR